MLSAVVKLQISGCLQLLFSQSSAVKISIFQRKIECEMQCLLALTSLTYSSCLIQGFVKWQRCHGSRRRPQECQLGVPRRGCCQEEASLQGPTQAHHRRQKVEYNLIFLPAVSKNLFFLVPLHFLD